MRHRPWLRDPHWRPLAAAGQVPLGEGLQGAFLRHLLAFINLPYRLQGIDFFRGLVRADSQNTRKTQSKTAFMPVRFHHIVEGDLEDDLRFHDAPEALVGKDSPPIYFEYDWGLTKPDDIKEMNYLVHSPRWGLGFQKMAKDRGATCYLRFPGHPSEKYSDMWDFILRELGVGSGTRSTSGKIAK